MRFVIVMMTKYVNIESGNDFARQCKYLPDGCTRHGLQKHVILCKSGDELPMVFSIVLRGYPKDFLSF